jgi:hypothetical protein
MDFHKAGIRELEISPPPCPSPVSVLGNQRKLMQNLAESRPAAFTLSMNMVDAFEGFL